MNSIWKEYIQCLYLTRAFVVFWAFVQRIYEEKFFNCEEGNTLRKIGCNDNCSVLVFLPDVLIAVKYSGIHVSFYQLKKINFCPEISIKRKSEQENFRKKI